MDKHGFRGIMASAVIIGIAVLFAGCNSENPGTNTQNTKTMTSTDSSGNTYVLIVNETDGTYTLTVTDPNGDKKESKGTFTEDNSGTFTLISNGSGSGSSEPVTVNTEGGKMTDMDGTITYTDGTSDSAPAELKPVIEDDSFLGETAEIKGVNPDLGGLSIGAGGLDFGYVKSNPLSNYLEQGYEVKIKTDGSLSLKLTEPKAEVLQSFSNSLTVNPSSMKWMVIESFHTQDGSKSLVQVTNDSSKFVIFCYADESGTVTGSAANGGDHAMGYNLTLKKGWNTIIADMTANTLKSDRPDNSYKWQVSNPNSN